MRFKRKKRIRKKRLQTRKDRILTLANAISISRIFLTIPLIMVFEDVAAGMGEKINYAFILIIIIALTDFLDGYVARKVDETTNFGKLIDPVADKLIVVSALGILLASYGTYWFTMPALVIIAREIVISALREWMAEVNRSGTVRVGLLAKVKTGVQMTAIACLLIAEPGAMSFWLVIGYLLIYLAAILTFWSMVRYLIAAWPSLRNGFTESSKN